MSKYVIKQYKYACKQGDLDKVKKYISQIDFKDNKNYTGFLIACIAGNLDIVKYHVENIQKFNFRINKLNNK